MIIVWHTTEERCWQTGELAHWAQPAAGGAGWADGEVALWADGDTMSWSSDYTGPGVLWQNTEERTWADGKPAVW